jgi:MFS superfamily sulfate permease-like transporter
MKNLKENLKSDFQSGLVVFLVALPLCLGIALASGAPLFAGIISGIIGGIVVGLISNSQLSVTGPAAGLTAIILSAITSLNSYESFLLAVIIAGALQILLGALKAGAIANYIPSNVIEGMLTAIGIIIILKQIPHAVGYDKDNEGDFFFLEATGNNTLSAIYDAINYSHPGSFIICLVSLLILIAFNKINFLKKIKLIPGALIAVIAGILINEFFKLQSSPLEVANDHLVKLPIAKSISDFGGFFSYPKFDVIANYQVWVVALTIAIVASIETLLCIEASDKMDPKKRVTNPNKELFAQGVGNLLSGLIGGLPMTSVIVRTSANTNAGAKSKMSTIIHGILILVCVITIPFIINKIPLASLAAILLMIGFKLAGPAIFKKIWSQGLIQFVPFIVTVIAIVFTDLLKGVGIGMVVSIFYILKSNLKFAYSFDKQKYHDGEVINIQLAHEVSFLNKAAIKETLHQLPKNSVVKIDASESFYIDYDIVELIHDFEKTIAPQKNITVEVIGLKNKYSLNNVPSHVTIN